MHCVLLHGDRGWELRRSIEVLGYYQSKREVVILKVLSVKASPDLKPSRRVLRMMHRGNVECFGVQCGPSASHPYETTTPSGESVWWSVYRKGFEDTEFHEKPGKLIRVKELSAWDTWYDEPRETNLWPESVTPSQDPFDPSRLIKPDTSTAPPAQYVPFTAWTLGPFKNNGEYLITLLLRFTGATYERLLGDGSRFSVDGPNRLLDAVEFSDLPSVAADELPSWQEQFTPFRSYLAANLGYDVILLNPPGADCVTVQASSGIMPGPFQPSADRARRFITAHRSFQLVLGYASQGAPSAATTPEGGVATGVE